MVEGSEAQVDGLGAVRRSSQPKHTIMTPLGDGGPAIPVVRGAFAPGLLRKRLAGHESLYFRPNVLVNEKLVIVFRTIVRSLGVNFETLTLSLEKMNADALFLDDRRRNFLLPGIRSWESTRADTIRVIEEIIAIEGKTRICALGHSSGATAALIYAMLLPVDTCLVLNPMTFFGAERKAGVV